VISVSESVSLVSLQSAGQYQQNRESDKYLKALVKRLILILNDLYEDEK
jgi:hypothetical protein